MAEPASRLVPELGGAIQGLLELVRIPSVSADPDRRGDCERAAGWVARAFEEAGLRVERIAAERTPIILGADIRDRSRRVIFYAHYDVQPPEPLEVWQTPPFKPRVVEGDGPPRVVGRGASDDKGQLVAVLWGLKAWRRAHGDLPFDVLFVSEGEEEVGSPGLQALIDREPERFRADAAIIVDCRQLARDVPAVVYGLRGLVYLEVEVTGPSHDLHSGTYGGAVDNPANVLVAMLSALWDAEGRVTVPGFYDRVRPLDAEERARIAAVPFDEEALRASTGVPVLRGEVGYTTSERCCARPSLDLNGLTAGFQGEGAKTVLPARAAAKLSARLVPDQDPEEIAGAVDAFLHDVAPASVRVRVIRHAGARPVLLPTAGPALDAARAAAAAVFGRDPVPVREGATVPVVNLLFERAGTPCVPLGFALPGDRVHSPNESFEIRSLERGIRWTTEFIGAYGGADAG